jgi:chaperonin GroES
MPDWEEEMDKLLMILPIVGCVFKKTYYDPAMETNVSTLIFPKDFVVNYWTKSIEQCERATHILPTSKNKLQEKINGKLFLDIDLGSPQIDFQKDTSVDPNEMKPNEVDETTPYTLLEQHCWLDLDGDDYAEPYIVTFDRESKKVLRIVARFTQESLQVDDEGKIIRITPDNYFTKFGFIPNPEGGFYDIGFGLLLGSINESVNTLVNQLIDAGSLSNLQAGFLAKGLRVKLGDSTFKPGEWKQVNATGDDLKKQIFPLPVRDPSNVLFQLLGMLIQSGKELASVAEIFVGKMPGQNTPATTTQATIEQGMKLFTAIFKRVFRSMTKEFRKLYKLNKQFYSMEKYVSILDNPAGQQDFEGEFNDIIPAADPAATTDTMKTQKADVLMNLLQTGQINPQETIKRVLEANSIQDLEPLLQVPPPPPDPKAQEMQMKMQMEQQKHEMDMKMKQMEMQMAETLQQLQIQLEQIKLQNEQARLQLEMQKLDIDIKRANMDAQISNRESVMDMQFKGMQHSQKVQQQQEIHSQKLNQQKESSSNGDNKE